MDTPTSPPSGPERRSTPPPPLSSPRGSAVEHFGFSDLQERLRATSGATPPQTAKPLLTSRSNPGRTAGRRGPVLAGIAAAIAFVMGATGFATTAALASDPQPADIGNVAFLTPDAGDAPVRGSGNVGGRGADVDGGPGRARDAGRLGGSR